jgi:hypothetical protein
MVDNLAPYARNDIYDSTIDLSKTPAFDGRTPVDQSHLAGDLVDLMVATGHTVSGSQTSGFTAAELSGLGHDLGLWTQGYLDNFLGHPSGVTEANTASAHIEALMISHGWGVV